MQNNINLFKKDGLIGLSFCTLIIFFCAMYLPTNGQQFKYTNTDNVIIRDCPDENYAVLLVLKKNAKVKIEVANADGAPNGFVLKNFDRISFGYKGADNKNNIVFGWVLKKYLKQEASKPLDSSKNETKCIEVPLELYSGTSEKLNPNKKNRFRYPYPKFKGGETSWVAEKRKYMMGPRGGCYYLNAKGTKIYVDKKYCEKHKK